MHVCICMWLPSSLWVHTKAIGPVSTTSFLRQGLSFKLKLTNLDRLVPRASGTCLSVTLLVSQTVCLHTWFVFGCWGSKLKSSCLCGRHWTYWAVLNSLFICVFLGNSVALVSLDSSVFHSVFKVSVSGHVYLSLSLSGWLGRVPVISTWQGPGTGEMVFL